MSSHRTLPAFIGVVTVTTVWKETHMDEWHGVTHWYADNPWESLYSIAGGSPCPGKLTPKTSAIWCIPYQKRGVSFKPHTIFLYPTVIAFKFCHFWWAPSMDLVLSPQCPWCCASSETACLWLKQESFPCSRISPSSSLNHPDCLFLWPFCHGHHLLCLPCFVLFRPHS